ncbi:UNVERIFIED_CONTAM: Auxin transporter-like protein 3 [Sesamum latifolium]|uniref:Auxin transporter-like protein 3 n=1 Tax=Sesamum latifolium TaxID=2727402 RepID=A0AAW2W8N3_9LAMI
MMIMRGSPPPLLLRPPCLRFSGMVVLFYDAWFSCASNQVAQVLLTLPYSFSQLGMVSGILFQLFYGLMGSWTAYLISVLYVEYRTRKEREKVDFRNHVIQWFEVLDGLLGKHWRNIGLFFNCTFLLFGSVIQLIACARSEALRAAGLVLYFTGATNILYTFGGHAVTVEIMHAMWKPQKFKLIYLIATIYVLTLTLPSASAVYWAFGDLLLNRSNALALLPRTGFRDTAVILMLIHQAAHEIDNTFSCDHEGNNNKAKEENEGKKNAVERAPRIVGGWTGLYVMNIFVVAWVFIVGFGFGGWASMVNFVHQINTFGLFAKCYQCPKHKV